MQLGDMEAECRRAIARWEDPELPKLPGEPRASFVVPRGAKLPPDLFGVPYEHHSNPRVTMLWVDARKLLAAIEYHRSELLVPEGTL